MALSLLDLASQNAGFSSLCGDDLTPRPCCATYAGGITRPWTKRCTSDTTMYLKSSRSTRSSTHLKETPTTEKKTKRSIRILMDCCNGLKPQIEITYLFNCGKWLWRHVYFYLVVMYILRYLSFQCYWSFLHCTHRTNLISLGKNRNKTISLHNVSNIYLVHCIIWCKSSYRC